MKNVISAGGVVVTRDKNGMCVLLIKDKTNHWTFPKGRIETGEKNSESAVREVREETGVDGLELVSDFSPVRYRYMWQEKLIQKTVYYYLFRTSTTKKLVPQKEEGIMEVRWIQYSRALSLIDYKKNNLQLLKLANIKLQKK